jgi:hypothetical protein
MKHIKLYEEYNSTKEVVEEVIKYEVIFDVVDVSSDPVAKEEFDNYEDALAYYEKTYEYDDGVYRTRTHSKMLDEITYSVSYEYDSDNEDKDDVDDDDKNWDIIDTDNMESEEYRINDDSENVLEQIEDWFKEKYDSNRTKYHEIDVYYNDDDYKTIQIRFSDHTENIMNNDRFRSKDYYISVVVSDYDVTDSRFGMSNSFERRNNEHELKYGSSDDTIQMEIDIDFLIKELKEEILEDFG